MATHNESMPDLGLLGPKPTLQPVFFYVAASVVFLVAAYRLLSDSSTKFELINPRRPFELTRSRVKQDFVKDAKEMVEERFKNDPNRPFRVYADHGEMIVFPPKYADEFRRDPRLSFEKPILRSFQANLPGFDGFRVGGPHPDIVKNVLKTNLTSALARVTEPLSEECTSALREVFTDNTEWHDVSLKTLVLQLVARLSSRVFLGEELCNNEAWLDITIKYTVSTFLAAEKLRLWPAPLRPIVHWFLPECRRLRAQVAETKALIGGVLERRRAAKAAARAEGRDEPEFDDAIEWFEKEASGRPYNPVNAQLGLSLAAIHTTSDLLTQALLDVAEHPEAVDALRAEIADVIGQDGWKKTSLARLKLLDSAVKETQRLKPIGIVSMRREVLKPMTLSDGTKLAKGTVVTVSSGRMWDPELHESPAEWRADRFLRLRETPGMENRMHLVSTGADHLAFGHGEHGCPGRFFAANEVKIALCHLLLKYDFAPAAGYRPTVRRSGFSLNVDPFAKVSLRRRKEEIDL